MCQEMYYEIIDKAYDEAALAVHEALRQALNIPGSLENNFWQCLEDYEADRRKSEEYFCIAKRLNQAEDHIEAWELYEVTYNNAIYSELMAFLGSMERILDRD